jgi:hypothetical protein
MFMNEADKPDEAICPEQVCRTTVSLKNMLHSMRNLSPTQPGGHVSNIPHMQFGHNGAIMIEGSQKRLRIEWTLI